MTIPYQSLALYTILYCVLHIVIARERFSLNYVTSWLVTCKDRNLKCTSAALASKSTLRTGRACKLFESQSKPPSQLSDKTDENNH